MFVVPAHHPVNSNGTVVCSCGKFHDAGKKGKHPAVAWAKFQNRCPDAGQVRLWFQGRFSGYNIAIIHGAASGTILLDWDGLEGYASQRQLELELGELPPTPTVLTGGGGSHMIYRHPGVPIPTNKGLRECFDVRGDGGISIMPPSNHEFGTYQWECDLGIDDIAIADLSQTWIDFLANSKVSIKQSANTTNVSWTPAPDGTILVSDGRELFMRDQVWGTLLKMMHRSGKVPSAQALVAEAAQNYMPYIDQTRFGRGMDELRAKCVAAVAKANKTMTIKRGLSRPFLRRN